MRTFCDSQIKGREASYSNFRFYPETLLADVLPRNVDQMMLKFHNEHNGRTGGASRWQDHLDDMPVAGWGYAALVNNQTNNFHAMLYGHMATYQSRGTFHTTEQLGFYGEGLYREFLHWSSDPLPPLDNTTGTITSTSNTGGGSSAYPEQALVDSAEFSQHHRSRRVWEAGASSAVGSAPPSLQYYGNENDISYCIVTQILAARLTRWQLVFEDTYRATVDGNMPTIWLARGAPLRWFQFTTGGGGGNGFNVTSVPTEVGLVSYKLKVDAHFVATYTVNVNTGSVSAGGVTAVQYSLRWPGKVGSPTLTGCELVAVENGVVTVKPTTTAAGTADASFSVAATFTV